MKRQQDRDSSPNRKRSRSVYSLPDHDSIRDRMSPDFERRDSRGKFGGKPYPRRDFDDVDPPIRQKYRNDRIIDAAYPPSVRDQSDKMQDEYRSLCISNIPSKLPDPVLKETLLQEFTKFGEMNIKVTISGDQRVAYINFRYPEHARTAKYAKSKLFLFERPLRIDAVYNKKRSNSPNSENRDQFFHRGLAPVRSPPHGMGSRRGFAVGHYQNIPREFPPGRPFNANNSNNSDDDQPMEHRRHNEKFPYHLDHIDPEFDSKATRTLFVGNLDLSISDVQLKHIFSKFGVVEDVDIKRPLRGQGNAYAFVKFHNLDCAHKAKVEMSGQYIGKFQCKIGYGKVTPTTCLWIGGLGPWVSFDTIEREFDRFGVISKIEWPPGRNYAFVLYNSIDGAQAACQDMRGFPAGGPERRLRVDFADPAQMGAPSDMPSPYANQQGQRTYIKGEKGPSPWKGSDIPGDRPRSRRDDWFPPDGDTVTPYRNPDNPRDGERVRGREDWDRFSNGVEVDRRRRPLSPGEIPPVRGGRSRTPDRPRGYVHDNNKEIENSRRSSSDFQGRDGEDRSSKSSRRLSEHGGDKEQVITEHVRALSDLAKCLPVAWNGALILKSSAFAACMHVVSGDVTLVDNLMRDPTSTETPVLRITQRLRMDPPKLEDVGRRIQSTGPHGHCILLAMPSTLQNYEDPTGNIQQRPLKNLVTYLKQKEAAGVISLPPNPTQDKNNIGVLHAFPPHEFGYAFLQKRAPNLPPEPLKEDYLVVAVVLGAV